MIVLAISDVHERVKNVSRLISELAPLGLKIDSVVIAGDLTYFKSINTAEKILLEIRNALNTDHVFFVPGNCDDPALLSVKEIDSGIINLHRNLIELGAYTLYGVGGGGVSPFNTLIEFSEEDFREHVNYLRHVHSDMTNTIIVTHQPIYGFFDEVNGLNIGSTIFREFLEKYQPLLWITGHVHENSGYNVHGRTIIVHPGPFMRGYYALIKLDDMQPRVLEVNIFKLKS